MRKNFVPAPDVARTAAAALAEEFVPEEDELEPSLELVLRRLKGHIIPPGSWNWEVVPPHLRVSFRVVDARGKVLGEDKDLARLQEELAPQTRRAIADSLGATPKTAKPVKQAKTASTPAAPASSGIQELTGLTVWTGGTLEREVKRLVAGHTVTGYPAFVDEGQTVAQRIYPTAAEQESAMRSGVIRLLALRVPSPQRYVLDHLNNTEKLTFSQNTHGSVASLIDDCTLAAIDKLVPQQLPWSKEEFDRLYEVVRAELIDTVFSVTAVVEKILSSNRRIQKSLKASTSLALISALNDIKSQLEQLVYPGFVARTGYAQLSHLPRYLTAIERRLEKLPTNVARDGQQMVAVQKLEDEYDDAVAALRPGSRHPEALRRVRWMLEELRVSFFAQELGTAYSISEKRVRAALNEALSK